MKKLIIIALAVLLTAFACTKRNTEKLSKTGEITIGISKIITHPALDAIEQGIKDELSRQGYKNIKYNVQNANGEFSTASSIANMFVNGKVDIAIGIATPTAQALANHIKDIPVVFSAVSDPVGAGLRSTFNPEAGNITGVCDMAPVRKQIILATELKPVKRIGHIYTPGEANSVAMMNVAKETCGELGIELLLSTVSNTSEVKQAAEVLAPKVDIIYISNDNTVVAALAGVTASATRYNVPVISADPSSAPTSGVAIAYGIDNYRSGVATGRLVGRILAGENPSDIEVKVMDEPDELGIYIDEELVEKFGLTVPEYLR